MVFKESFINKKQVILKSTILISNDPNTFHDFTEKITRNGYNIRLYDVQVELRGILPSPFIIF